jgi:uncharacterized protein YkwD
MVRRRWRALAIGTAFGAVAGCVVAPGAPPRAGRGIATAPVPAPSEADPEAILAGLVAAHNRARAEAGRPALEAEARLTAAAREHARFMAARRRLSHRGRGGSSPFQRIEAQGYRFRRAGENIAVGPLTLDELMRAWLRSPGHRRNILGAFSQIGAARATAEDGASYWCVTFGDPWGR